MTDEFEDSPETLTPLFLCSEKEDGRAWISTMGFILHGVPELQMFGIAPNHRRAARFLMLVIAQKLATGDTETIVDTTGSTLEVSYEDVPSRMPFLFTKPEHSDISYRPVEVRLAFQKMPEDEFDEMPDEDEEESGGGHMLTVLPPESYTGTPDEWLVETCRALGQDAPDALPMSAIDAQMQAARDAAQASLEEFRDKLRAGLPGDQNLGIKWGLQASDGTTEYVWAVAESWPEGGPVQASLESEPRQVEGYELGQHIEIPENEIYDVMIGGATDGIVHPGFTQQVAEEFGLDL